MRVVLLNLPVDNNYGGMLQRYALVRVIESMGHEVIHLNLRFQFNRGPFINRVTKCAKRLVGRFLGKYSGPIMPEYRTQKEYVSKCAFTDAFYYKFIKHSKVITDKNALRLNCKGDAIIVGSDQVWRKTIAAPYGIDTFFLDFLSDNCSIKKIAYGVSLGVSENELSTEEIIRLTRLYQQFAAVSVRELSGAELLHQYGWEKPEAQVVLDPTLLLSKQDYCTICEGEQLISNNKYMLCYILDPNDSIKEDVKKIAYSRDLTPFFLSLDSHISIEKWLQSFRDAEYVVTDSYHGVVFSIIMRKNFKLLGNNFRGNARFESLIKLLEIKDTDNVDWNVVSANIENLRSRSFDFLKNALS